MKKVFLTLKKTDIFHDWLHSIWYITDINNNRIRTDCKCHYHTTGRHWEIKLQQTLLYSWLSSDNSVSRDDRQWPAHSSILSPRTFLVVCIKTSGEMDGGANLLSMNRSLTRISSFIILVWSLKALADMFSFSETAKAVCGSGRRCTQKNSTSIYIIMRAK